MLALVLALALAQAVNSCELMLAEDEYPFD
jgi:hypothetical protein